MMVYDFVCVFYASLFSHSLEGVFIVVYGDDLFREF